MKKKKVLTMALGFLLTAVMAMPSAAFAETWGSGDSEKEKGSDVIVDYEPGEPGGGYDNPEKINSIRFKSGELAPFTFYNAEKEIGGRELDSIGKPRLAYAQLEDWVQVATKIYSSMSQIGGSGLSGVTWDGPTAQPGKKWEEWFEKDSFKNGDINLPDWLRKEDRYKDSVVLKEADGTPSAYSVSCLASGFQSTDSLATLRDHLMTDTGTMTNHKAKHFYSGRKKNGGTLSDLDDSTPREVYYSYVIHDHNFGFPGNLDYFNTYGVALYDFEYVPVEGHGLRYPNQQESIEQDPDHPDPIPSKDYTKNYGTGEISKGVEYDNHVTQSQNNSMTSTSSTNFGGEFGGSFRLGKDDWPIGVTISGKGDFHKTLETTKTAGEEVTQTSGGTSTIDTTIPAHGAVTVEGTELNRWDTINYNCPVSIRYKVAIFSMTGSINLTTAIESPGDLCTTFGAKGCVAANDDANTNLYERAQKKWDQGGEFSSDATLARTRGYYKDDLKMDHVDWSHNAFNQAVTLNKVSKPLKEVVRYRATSLPMAEPGMKVHMFETITEQIRGADAPLYYLHHFDPGSETKKEYNLMVNSAFPIDGFSVVGKDAEGVKYCGFDWDKGGEEKGRWMIAETGHDGEPLDTEAVELVTDPQTGLQKVVAKQSGTSYLTWQLKETTDDGQKIEFYSIEDEITVSAAKNPPVYPYIKFTVKDPENTPVDIRFDSNVPEKISGVVEEAVNLPTSMPVNVVNADGMVIDHSCKYILNDTTIPSSKAEIDDSGNFIAHEPGEYEIKARYSYKDGEEPKNLTTTDCRTINVEEARNLILKSVDATGHIGPKFDGIFPLNHCVNFQDQYGGEWKGNDPDLVYSLIGSKKLGEDMEKLARVAVIEGSRLRVDARTIGEGDTFTIRAEAENMTGVEPVEFNYKIIPAPVADMPQAVKGLVFNNRTQTGVQGGNGYTLTGENAVNAGDYEARATLEDGYRYWEDGVMVKARSIPYAIAPAKVEIPAARKLTYNGNQQTGVAATPGSVVKNNAQVNAGAYTATAELQSKENYRWNDGTTADKSIKWAIDKADTPFTVNGKTAKVKYKKLKKKIQRVKHSRVLTVSKAQGTVAYRKISVGSKKTNKKYGRKISINSSNGNVTVKRGLKKGTYKVKVEVSDAGNNNYNGSTRTVTFKIKVK